MIGTITDAIAYALSRAVCHTLGHRWSPVGRHGQVCTRTACRGHADAQR